MVEPEVTQLENECVAALRIRSLADAEAPEKRVALIFLANQPIELAQARANNKKNLDELELARKNSAELLDLALVGNPTSEFLARAIDHLEEHGRDLCGHGLDHDYDNLCNFLETCFACTSLKKIKSSTRFKKG